MSSQTILSAFPSDDRYFRFHFADTRRMAGLLREFLPQDLVETLDFNTLRRLHEQHLGEELRELRDDLNLECRTLGGQRVLVRLLVEHKSLHDPGLWLQLLKSMVAYWNHTGFSAVIPVVVHTGPQVFRLETPADWLCSEPRLATWQPTFPVCAIDLALCGLERIHNSIHLDAVAKIALGILKLSREASLLPGVRNLFNAMSPQLTRKRRLRILQQARLYLQYRSSGTESQLAEWEESMPLVHPINPDSTFAKEMREEHRKGVLEGFERGIEQGLQRGLDLEKIAIIQGMLARGYGWNVIEDITHLDEAGFWVLKEKYEKIES